MINKLLKSYLPFMVLAVGLFSCSNDDDGSSVPSSFMLNEAATISSDRDGDQISVTEDLADLYLMHISWNKPSATANTRVFHVLQMDVAGNNFADPVDVKNLDANSINLNGTDLNTAAAQLGAFPGQPISVDIRLNSSVNKEDWLSSNVLSVTITPYDPNPIDGSFVYLAEGYPRWNFLTAHKLTSPSDNGIYGNNYFVFPEATSFMIINPAAPETPWGAGDSDGVLIENGSLIEIAEAGMYQFEINPSSTYYKALKTDWGVIGSATPMDWNDETPLSLDLSTGIWSGTVELKTGELKFRANHDWGINLGDNNTDGSLEPGGANIPNESVGPTKVVLDFSDPANPTYQVGDVVQTQLMTGEKIYLSTDGSTTAGMESLYSADQDGNYSGFLSLTTSDSFQLIDPDYNDGEVWGSDNNSDIAPGAGTISVDADGFYFVNVNLKDEMISMYLIESMAVVGPATGLGWPTQADGTDGEDLDMTIDAAAQTFTFQGALVVGEFKFRPNNRWDQFDLGGSDTDGVLAIKGGNLSNDTAGTFTITVDVSDDTNYTYTVQ